MPGAGNIVWLASYPKSGNTWVRALLTAVLTGHGTTPDLGALVGTAEFAERQFLDDVCGVDSANLTYRQLLSYLRSMRLTAGSEGQAPLFVKTHDRFGFTAEGLPLFPAEVTRTAIYIVRNPLDVAASFAAHNGSAIDPAIDRMGDPAYALNADPQASNEFLPVDIGSWSDNVLSWTDQTAIPVLVVRYEDLLADPVSVLQDIVVAAGLDCDHQQLEAAVAACTFDRLRQAEVTSGFGEKPAGMPVFFRSGRAGSGMAELSSAQAKRIEAQHGAAMARFGYAKG
jgi:aryl sulfotransferase